MDLTAFDGPLGYVATVAVGAIIAVGATTFLPRVAMATVRWARSLIDGGDDDRPDFVDEDGVRWSWDAEREKYRDL